MPPVEMADECSFQIQDSLMLFCTTHSFEVRTMKSTKVPIILYRSHALEHLPQSTEPRAVLGSKYVMATPTQFVKLSER